MRKIDVTAIVITKNEELALPACLESLRSFDEVVVVDSGSTDATAEVVETYGRRLLNFTWDGAYPKKKEWAMAHSGARHDWVLMIDADERVSPALCEEIAATLPECTENGFLISLDYIFLGRQLRHGYRVQKLCLTRSSATKWPHPRDLSSANMWEVEGHYQPLIDGQVATLKGRIVHDDPDPLYDYFSRHNRYSDWEAEAALHGAPTTRRLAGRIFHKIPLKPLMFVLYAYIFKLGFLDGRPGREYAIANAFYYWQISVKRFDARRRGEKARNTMTPSTELAGGVS